jgi:hypothetical protein
MISNRSLEAPMRARGTALTLGLVWSTLATLVGLAHMVRPAYGAAFLSVLASLHPSYQVDGGLQSVLMLAVLCAVDAAALGYVGGLLYDRITRRPAP